MTIVLGCLLILLSVASLFVGVIDVNIPGLFSGDLEQWKVFLISRIPRLLAILCTGVGMSVAGLIMQQLCMNKFVSPTTGATISSAQFGILLALLFMPASTIWSRALFAFVCAVLGTWIFVWFIQRIQFKDVVMVPLVGIMFGNVIGGITNYLAYKYEMTQALSSWLVGHFSVVLSGNYELVWLAVPLVVLAFLFANHFNIVGMGKDFSKNLGVPYNLVLFLGLSIAAMITASVVVVVGSISYIGLIVPNVVAMFKGDKIRGTLVDTALFGAVFVLVCDMAARVVISPYELPIPGWTYRLSLQPCRVVHCGGRHYRFGRDVAGSGRCFNGVRNHYYGVCRRPRLTAGDDLALAKQLLSYRVPAWYSYHLAWQRREALGNQGFSFFSSQPKGPTKSYGDFLLSP